MTFLSAMLCALSFLSYLDVRAQLEKDISITREQLELLVDSENGGRIAQLIFKKTPVLFGKDKSTEFYGSVWWPAPQKDWHWPPPEAFDTGPYDVKVNDHSIVAQSKVCKQTGIELTKIYQLLANNRLSITYTAHNVSTEKKRLGHWEITRLPKGGTLLFPSTDMLHQSNDVPSDLLYVDHFSKRSGYFDDDSGCFDFTVTEQQKNFKDEKQKLSAAGDGWSSYTKNGVLFIKIFDKIEVSDLPIAHGGVEVYIAETHNYLELEQLSQSLNLCPGERFSWTVHWLLVDKYPKKVTSSKLRTFIETYITETLYMLPLD